jgi:hypothetical protein
MLIALFLVALVVAANAADNECRAKMTPAERAEDDALAIEDGRIW